MNNIFQHVCVVKNGDLQYYHLWFVLGIYIYSRLNAFLQKVVETLETGTQKVRPSVAYNKAIIWIKKKSIFSLPTNRGVRFHPPTSKSYRLYIESFKTGQVWSSDSSKAIRWVIVTVKELSRIILLYRDEAPKFSKTLWRIHGFKVCDIIAHVNLSIFIQRKYGHLSSFLLSRPGILILLERIFQEHMYSMRYIHELLSVRWLGWHNSTQYGGSSIRRTMKHGRRSTCPLACTTFVSSFQLIL